MPARAMVDHEHRDSRFGSRRTKPHATSMIRGRSRSQNICAHKPTLASVDVLSNLLIERGRWTQSDQNRVARCLKVLGWERHCGPRPLREWRYRRVAPVESGTDAKDRDQQPIDI